MSEVFPVCVLRPVYLSLFFSARKAQAAEEREISLRKGAMGRLFPQSHFNLWVETISRFGTGPLASDLSLSPYPARYRERFCTVESDFFCGEPALKRNPPFPSQAESGIIGAPERPSQTFHPKMPACSFAGLEHIFLREVPFHGA